MAIALANDDATNSIPQVGDGSDAVTFTCNAGGPANDGIYTPGANSLLVLIFGIANGSADPSVAPTGHGLSYTSIDSLTTSSLGRLFVYAANSGASPTSAASSVTFAATQQGCVMYDLEFTGVELSGGVATAFVQKVSNSVVAGTTVQNVLAAAGNANNRPLSCCYISVNSAITEDASFAEIHDRGHSAPTRRLSASWQSGGFDTTVDHTFATANGRSISMELLATGGGGGFVSADPFGMSGLYGA